MEIFIFLPLLAKSIRWNRLALSFQQLECLKIDLISHKYYAITWDDIAEATLEDPFLSKLTEWLTQGNEL